MRTRSLAPLAITLIILLTSTLSFAQSQGYTITTLAPDPPSPRSVYAEPIIIPTPSAPTTTGIQESTVYNLNTGTMTLISQEGNHITVIRP
jgi:hypothetical protein